MKLAIPRLLKRAALALASASLALLALEVLVRFVPLGRLPEPRSEGVYVRDSAHPEIEQELIPNAVNRIHYRRDWSSEPVVAEARIGPHGFRACTLSAEKPPDTLRIVCLGDSMTFGRGVNDGETWPARLQAELEAKLDVPVEVWNCGMVGDSTAEQLVLLRARALAFEPDLVLLGYYFNDVNGGRIPKRREVLGELEDSILAVFHPGPSNAFLRSSLESLRANSVLFETAFTALGRRCEGRVTTRVHEAAYLRDSGGWRKTKRSLRAMKTLLEEDDTPLGVVLLPLMKRSGGFLASHRAYEVVAEFCSQEGIPCLDPGPRFEGLDPRELIVHPLDHHLNAKAYGVVGRAVADFVLEAGLVR